MIHVNCPSRRRYHSLDATYHTHCRETLQWSRRIGLSWSSDRRGGKRNQYCFFFSIPRVALSCNIDSILIQLSNAYFSYRNINTFHFYLPLFLYSPSFYIVMFVGKILHRTDTGTGAHPPTTEYNYYVNAIIL